VKINGALVKRMDLYTNNITTGWVEDVVDLSTYAGTKITLLFEVTTDSWEISTLYLDDISLMSSGITGLN